MAHSARRHLSLTCRAAVLLACVLLPASATSAIAQLKPGQVIRGSDGNLTLVPEAGDANASAGGITKGEPSQWKPGKVIRGPDGRIGLVPSASARPARPGRPSSPATASQPQSPPAPRVAASGSPLLPEPKPPRTNQPPPILTNLPADHPLHPDNLKPGNWVAIPDSSYTKQCPEEPPYAAAEDGYSAAVPCGYGYLRDWNGGTWDEAREDFKILGGGHASAAGQNIFAFDVPRLAWRLIKKWGTATKHDDGKWYFDDPRESRAAHTYGGVPVIGDLLLIPGVASYRYQHWGNGGTAGFRVFDLSTGKFVDRIEPDHQAFPTVSVYLPEVGKIIYLAYYGALEQLDLKTRTWSRLHNGYADPKQWGASGVYDLKRKCAVFRGNTHFLRVCPGKANELVEVTGAGMGRGANGIAYDFRNDRYVWRSGGCELYAADPDRWTVVKLAMAGNCPVDQVAAGTYDRFAYDAKRDAFVGVFGNKGRVWFARVDYAKTKANNATPAPTQAPGTVENILTRDFSVLPPNCSQCNEGIFTNTDPLPNIDNGQLRFTIRSNTGAGAGGAYFVKFGDQAAKPGQSLEVRWRQRFDKAFFEAAKAGHGFKIAILGDAAQYSCSTNEIVFVARAVNSVVSGYHACGKYQGLYTGDGAGNLDLQPGGDNACPYSNVGDYREVIPGGCYFIVPDETFKFEVRLDIAADPQAKSRVRLWVTRESRARQLVIDYSRVLVDANKGYGAVWLLPYNTGKKATIAHREGHTWYDDLTIRKVVH